MLFVNCTLDDIQVLESNFDGNSDFSSLASNVNSDNDVSDFSWDKVIWIADEINVSSWRETSQIISVEITQQGGICVNHTQKDTWPGGNENSRVSNQPLIASLWAIVKLNGQYYAATWELALRGETCKLGHYDPNGTLSKLYESVWNEHFKSGLLRSSWQPRGGGVVGFMASGLARHLHHHSIRERSNIQWYRLPSIDGSISGQMLHSTSNGDGNSSPTPTSTTSSTCNTAGGHYKKVGERCLPSCGHANNLYCQRESASGRQCGEIARGARCSETNNFNIHILETYEQNTCCNRKPKSGGGGQPSNVCLPTQKAPHYKVVGQRCLPSCGHAANMAGYGGYGPDNQKRTSDDPHVYGSNVNSCANLERFGHSDWRNFSWTDRRTSKTMNNSQIYSVILRGGVCCVRGNPTTRTTRANPITPIIPATPANPVIPTNPITSTTLPNLGLIQRSDNPPNMLHVVQRVANKHPRVLLRSCRKGHETLDFLDLVLTELRKENEGIRWGFNCKRGDCNHLSIDAIAYYRGTGSIFNNSTDVAIFDIIASCHSDSPRAAWSDVTQATKDAGAIGRYKYPR